MEIQRKTEQQISFKDTKTKRKKGNIHFSVTNDKFNRTKMSQTQNSSRSVCVFFGEQNMESKTKSTQEKQVDQTKCWSDRQKKSGN